MAKWHRSEARLSEQKSREPDAPGISRRSFLASTGTVGMVAALDTRDLAAQSPPTDHTRNGRSARHRATFTAHQWQGASASHRSADDAARLHPRNGRSYRHQKRLRPRPMRRLHGACEWQARELLPEPGTDARRRRDHDDRRPGHARRIASDAGGIRRPRRYQCGYCTSGQIMSAVALLKEPCGPDDADVKELMSGNICRCGAYANIVAAIQQVRKELSRNRSSSHENV